MNFLQDDLEKIRRKSKENYGVSVNSLWRVPGVPARTAIKKARPSRMAGAGTGNAVKNNQALSLAMAAFTRARVSSLPSMAARSVPPPGVR